MCKKHEPELNAAEPDAFQAGAIRKKDFVGVASSASHH